MWVTDRQRAFLAALALATIALSTAVATAAPGDAVTEADIAAARRGQPSLTEQDLQRARERHRTPTDEELRRVPLPSTPRVDKLPMPPARAPIDLEALSRGFADTSLTGKPPISRPSLLIFISFAMPEATLTRLAEQASRIQATLVLRGLVGGSMVQTVARVQRLIAGRRVAVQIDPQAYDRYSVVRTPSFVLVRDPSDAQTCAGGLCAPSYDFALVAGDVSVDYALRYLQRSSPGFSSDAGAVLRRLVR